MTSTEPAYLGGEFAQRPAPNFSHSRVQVRLSDAFKPAEDRRRLFRTAEISLRIAPDRVRVADFALFSTEHQQQMPDQAPYAVVEVSSPDDRYAELMAKLHDYEQAGIEFIYVAQPRTGKLSRYREGNLLSTTTLALPEHEVSIPLAAIFG